MLGNYVVTIVHITSFNAYKVINLQVTRNIENQVVKSNCAGFINLIYFLFIYFFHKQRTNVHKVYTNARQFQTQICTLAKLVAEGGIKL